VKQARDRVDRLLQEAEVLQRHGSLAEAERRYRRAIALSATRPEAHFGLGLLLQELDRHEEALSRYAVAAASQPDLAEAHNNMGNSLQALGRHDEALAKYETAIAIRPAYAVAFCNLANALSALARHREAVARYREALALDPDDSSTHSNLLMALNYMAGLAPGAIFDEHKAWGQRHARPRGNYFEPRTINCAPDRRLRIGYISPDFRQHAVAWFIAPLLKAHDRNQVETVCFADVPKGDAITERLRSLAHHWHDIHALGDVQVAELVREQRIDILVDLAGHTGGNRLRIFADRLAPVQATWLGYLNTTGLATMDWRITDGTACPAEADGFHTEALARLADCQWCYQPPATSPEPGRLPATAAGHVTLGAFHNLAKVNDEVVTLWARVLKALPEARLVLAAAGSPRVPDSLAIRFADRGIGRERLELHGQMSFDDYLRLHRRIDLGLDTFPYSGGTSTFHSLWMGVPVITLAGNTMTSRGGASILGGLGLGGLVATSVDGYVRTAARLAADLDALAKLRAELRPCLASSPLTDASRFAREIERSYRSMWRQWCAGRV